MARILLLALAMVAASCSKSGSPGSGAGGGGGTGGTLPIAGAGGGGSGGVGQADASAGGVTGSGGGSSTTADAAVQPKTQMRFLQVLINGGHTGAFDLYTQLPDYSWYSVYRALGYGQLTDFIEVPNGKGNNTIIWYVPAGRDPAMYYVSLTDQMNFHITEADTGKHTVFSYFVGPPSDWSHVMVNDADPRLAPPSGYAHVDFITYAIEGSYPVMDYSSSGVCVDRTAHGYYQRLTVGSYQFSIYAGDKTDCQGSLIATTPEIQLGDGEVWHLYAMGDATNGFALMPVKLDRN
jgi:hypothetical protein